MTTCNDIIRFMEEVAPPETAEEWDNVGLLCGDPCKAVKKLMLCMDASSLVIEEAVSENIDLLISHHPLIFKSLKRIVECDFKGRLLIKLIRSGISLYSAHTNLDLAVLGVNQQLAECLGLQDIRSLAQDDQKPGFGKTGVLDEGKDINCFAEDVKKALGAECARVIGRPSGKIKKVAVFSGSFDDDLNAVKASGADILVTGDVKYHTAMDALEMGLCILDAGHFNTERIILKPLAGIIEDRFQEVQVSVSRVEKDPFITY